MKPLYLEPDEEITSVIDKISAESGRKLAIVVPKNSTLFQSLVNLKLLAREAKKLDKEVVIVSANKVGQRLARQVGIEAFASIGTLREEPETPDNKKAEAPPPPETLPDGTPIHQYVPNTPIVANEETPPIAPAEPAVEPKDEVVPDIKAPDPEPAVETIPVVGDVPSPVLEKPLEQPKPEPREELPSIISRQGPAVRERREFNFVMPWKSVIAALIILLIAFAVTYVFLPKAKVVLTIPAPALSGSLTLTTTPAVTEVSESTIPGNELQAEKVAQKTITATGKKDVGAKASGSIPIKNCEDTSSHSVASGTKVTASGKNFTNNTAVTIPAGTFSGGGSVCTSSSVNVAITATEAGDSYNLSGATFTISGLSSRISGTGSTTGGVTKQITVLSQDDVDKAYKELQDQATTGATADLKTKADKQTILEAGIWTETKDKTVSKDVGAQTDTADASLKVVASVIAFDGQQAKQKITDSLTKQLKDNQQLVFADGTEPTFTFKSLANDKQSMAFEVAAQGYATAKVTKNDVAHTIARKTVTQADKELRDKYGATDVQITITPSWWLKRLPILSSAISVEYGFKPHQDNTPSQ